MCSFSFRSEGLTVFCWSFIFGYLSFDSFFSRVDTGHVFLCSMFRHPSVGCITCECSSLPYSLLWLSSCGFSFLSGLFSLWLPYPGVNPIASLVTLLYSFRLTQMSTPRTVLIYVVCLSLCFPHYSSLCLPDGLQFFCHGPFWLCCGCPW